MTEKTEESDTVTISKAEYDQLISDQVKLECLESHGVDNWDWYDEAMDDFRAWKKGENQ